MVRGSACRSRPAPSCRRSTLLARQAAEREPRPARLDRVRRRRSAARPRTARFTTNSSDRRCRPYRTEAMTSLPSRDGRASIDDATPSPRRAPPRRGSDRRPRNAERHGKRPATVIVGMAGRRAQRRIAGRRQAAGASNHDRHLHATPGAYRRRTVRGNDTGAWREERHRPAGTNDNDEGISLSRAAGVGSSSICSRCR